MDTHAYRLINSGRTFTRIASILVITLLLCACGGKLAGLENGELAAKRDECIRNDPTAPGRVTACENIRKECERRRKDGIYVC